MDARAQAPSKESAPPALVLPPPFPAASEAAPRQPTRTAAPKLTSRRRGSAGDIFFMGKRPGVQWQR